MIATPRSCRGALAAGVVLVLITFFFNVRSLAVGRISVGEEHLEIGENFLATGVLSIDEKPSLFRPPGFPVFAAMVLAARDVLAPEMDSGRAVAFAHAGLLSAGALALLFHACGRHGLAVAFVCAALYGLQPALRLVAKAIMYPTLHLVGVTVATLALSHAVGTGRRRTLHAFLAGVLWGATTLVKPVSLILPPFVLLLARWHGGKGSWRDAIRFTGVFVAGMAVVIAPYTIRNYGLSGRLVVVNAQDGWAFWSLSATRDPMEDGKAWNKAWKDEGEAIFKRVTGAPAYSIEALYANVLPLNDAYRARAAENIRRDPLAFARTLAINLYKFNADNLSWWFDLFSDFESPRALAAARMLTNVVLLAGLAGLVRGLRHGDAHARTLAVVYVMFCISHSIAFQLARYNYVRLPLALLAIPLALRRADTR